jgi:diamine N-acetyltransferase
MNTEEHTVTRDSEVSLREITADTVREICKLSVMPSQKNLVAENAISIAQAHFSDHAWFRAIYADDTAVGFIMLHDEPEKPEYFLWRMMIDGRYQRMGFARRAMEFLIEYVRTRPNATQLLTSVVQEEGGPQGFYEGLGFELTGEYEEKEAVMRLGPRATGVSCILARLSTDVPETIDHGQGA